MVVLALIRIFMRPYFYRMKDGSEIIPSEKFTVEYDSTNGRCRLTIQDFSRADESIYKCVASNPFGQAFTKANLSLEVVKEEAKKVDKEFAPKFVKELADTRVGEGKSVALECKVAALPEAEIKWFK